VRKRELLRKPLAGAIDDVRPAGIVESVLACQRALEDRHGRGIDCGAILDECDDGLRIDAGSAQRFVQEECQRVLVERVLRVAKLKQLLLEATATVVPVAHKNQDELAHPARPVEENAEGVAILERGAKVFECSRAQEGHQLSHVRSRRERVFLLE
jgi:hypothetical protein